MKNPIVMVFLTLILGAAALFFVLSTVKDISPQGLLESQNESTPSSETNAEQNVTEKSGFGSLE